MLSSFWKTYLTKLEVGKYAGGLVYLSNADVVDWKSRFSRGGSVGRFYGCLYALYNSTITVPVSPFLCRSCIKRLGMEIRKDPNDTNSELWGCCVIYDNFSPSIQNPTIQQPQSLQFWFWTKFLKDFGDFLPTSWLLFSAKRKDFARILTNVEKNSRLWLAQQNK